MNAAQLMGGGGGDYPFVQTFLTSGMFTAPKGGWYRFTGIGGGGSGAASSAAGGAATGGSAAGLVQKRVWMTAGQTATITVGAGGVQVTVTGGVAQGNDGNDTTIVVGGVTLTAGKGKGGTAGAANKAGAVGGAATNGDLNVPGGNSGDADYFAGAWSATGGGAVGANGAGFASGKATVSAGGFSARTGGAGIGGKSGDATASSADAGSMGAGSGGPSPSNTNAVTTISGPDVLGNTVTNVAGALPTGFFRVGLFGFACGTGGGAQGSPGAEGGGGASAPNNAASVGGAFAGGGASAQNGGANAGAGGKFGGGGGAASGSAGFAATSGKGGNGSVFVEIQA